MNSRRSPVSGCDPSCAHGAECSQSILSISSDFSLPNTQTPFSLGNEKRPARRSALRQSLTLHAIGDEWVEDFQHSIDPAYDDYYEKWADSDWDGALVEWDGGFQEDAHMNPPNARPPTSNSPSRTRNRFISPDISPRLQNIPTQSTPQVRIPPSQTRNFPVLSPLKKPQKSPTKSRKKKDIPPTSPSRKQPATILDSMEQHDFNALMQAAIQDDTRLYLRILRYEPVNFGEFVTLAIGNEVLTRRLALKIRVFLDAKVSAILSVATCTHCAV